MLTVTACRTSDNSKTNTTVSSWCGVDNPAQKFETFEHEIRSIKKHPKGSSV